MDHRIPATVSFDVVARLPYLQIFEKLFVSRPVSVEIVAKHGQIQRLPEATRPGNQQYGSLRFDHLFNKQRLVNKIVVILYHVFEVRLSDVQRFHFVLKTKNMQLSFFANLRKLSLSFECKTHNVIFLTQYDEKKNSRTHYCSYFLVNYTPDILR
jgi:hypothetical protein